MQIQKLAKMKFQDNFDLLCWFRKHIPAVNSNYLNYKPFERRDAVADIPKVEDTKILMKGNKFAVRMKDISTSR